MTSPTNWIAFPASFVWGAATAAYQIEGAVTTDGRGLSIWDTFCQREPSVTNGDSGDVACNHYHRYREDIDLMAELGLHAYRFSVAWPRILPDATGRVNQAGLDFYDRLVNALLEKGIEPWITLYHWDLPQVLQDAGGWPGPAAADAFVTYADIVSRCLGDRVRFWTTLNEPMVSAFAGYASGAHAPGVQDWPLALQAAHNLLLAHGRAVPVLRANSPQAQVGITLNLCWADAYSDTPEDQAAARRFDGYFNRWFLDPVLRGVYPDDMRTWYGASAPRVEPDDLATIAAPLDFLGVNYYHRAVVRHAEGEDLLHLRQEYPIADYTDMNWEIYPRGLYNMLMRLQRDYAPAALYITENGAAFDDTLSADGQVHDTNRQQFLKGYLAAAQRAITEGVALKGYFVWSLLDNFEWALGYSKRFGIIYVDFPTQRRVIKQSARWYARVIRANGFNMPLEPEKIQILNEE